MNTAAAALLPAGFPQELTPEGFESDLRSLLEAEIRIFPARSWWPSQLGHPCDRHLVWRFTKWQLQDRYSWVLQSIFDEGKLHQPSIYDRLERLGFDVVRESDRPVQYKLANGGVVSGRPDGKIRGYRGQRYRSAIVLEAKAPNGYDFDQINSIDDVVNSRKHTIRGYADQGYFYNFLEELPLGVLAIKSKQTGVVKTIPFELDYARAEWLLARAERLQGLVEKQIDPEPIPYDPSVCGRCPFRSTCYPARSFGEGAAVIDDPSFLEDLEDREWLLDAHRRYEALDRSVKARLKHAGIELAVCGDFTIEGFERTREAYAVKATTFTQYDIRRPRKAAPQREDS